jgi:hypothetical protein
VFAAKAVGADPHKTVTLTAPAAGATYYVRAKPQAAGVVVTVSATIGQ